MSDKIQIITTGDGSHSLINTELNETYHSVHGALQESLHVFIRHGLEFFCERSTQRPVCILEVGLGTGLNALLTAQRASVLSRQIEYTSLEAFPLPETIWSALNYTHEEADKNLFHKIHQAEWSTAVDITDWFRLLKKNITLQQSVFQSSSFDVIYFDAFAPSKQPELWEIGLLEKISAAMKPGAVFVTYCAKGQLKRDLKKLDLVVEALNGPPGKKEMVRALKT